MNKFAKYLILFGITGLVAYIIMTYFDIERDSAMGISLQAAILLHFLVYLPYKHFSKRNK